MSVVSDDPVADQLLKGTTTMSNEIEDNQVTADVGG